MGRLVNKVFIDSDEALKFFKDFIAEHDNRILRIKVEQAGLTFYFNFLFEEKPEVNSNILFSRRQNDDTIYNVREYEVDLHLEGVVAISKIDNYLKTVPFLTALEPQSSLDFFTGYLNCNKFGDILMELVMNSKRDRIPYFRKISGGEHGILSINEYIPVRLSHDSVSNRQFIFVLPKIHPGLDKFFLDQLVKLLKIEKEHIDHLLEVHSTSLDCIGTDVQLLYELGE